MLRVRVRVRVRINLLTYGRKRKCRCNDSTSKGVTVMWVLDEPRSNPGKSPARLSLWALFAETLWLGPEVQVAVPAMRPVTGGRRHHQSCSRVERCHA